MMSSFDYLGLRGFLAFLGPAEGAEPESEAAEGGGWPWRAASLSSLPDQNSWHECSGSSASIAGSI